MAEQRESKLVELFALWKNTSQSGETYLSGNLAILRFWFLKTIERSQVIISLIIVYLLPLRSVIKIVEGQVGETGKKTYDR